MSQRPPHLLDYASPPPLRRFNPAMWPSIPSFIVLLGLAAFLSVTVARLVPGGPFISIHADIVPLVASIVAFHLAWRSLRSSGIARRVALLCILLGCVAILFFTIADVVSFWSRPYARGVLIGW
jgi:hypothetical protein